VDGTIDTSTGLTHLGAREYDPELGRFISVDPIMDLSDPQQMHGYTYSKTTCPASTSANSGRQPCVRGDAPFSTQSLPPHSGTAPRARGTTVLLPCGDCCEREQPRVRRDDQAAAAGMKPWLGTAPRARGRRLLTCGVTAHGV
jgi:RHS repeat-associated protein